MEYRSHKSTFKEIMKCFMVNNSHKESLRSGKLNFIAEHWNEKALKVEIPRKILNERSIVLTKGSLPLKLDARKL